MVGEEGGPLDEGGGPTAAADAFWQLFKSSKYSLYLFHPFENLAELARSKWENLATRLFKRGDT